MMRQKGTHLTLEDRIMIQDMLDNKETRISIANKLNVNRSTITKEINRNSTTIPINEYFRHSNCKYKHDCYSKNPCKSCAKFEPIQCKHKLKYSICNECSKFKNCKLAKTIYDAVNANKKATQLLTESRQGFNLTIEEINYIGDILKKIRY